jgi:hypothetical protein
MLAEIPDPLVFEDFFEAVDDVTFYDLDNNVRYELC